MKKIIFSLILFLALAGGAAWWWFSRTTETGPTIIATTTVENHDVRKVLEATGIIKAEVGAQVKIGARASGTIERMLVKVGDEVKKGDLIAVIDDREPVAQLRELKAQLERNQAELERIERVYPLQIKEAEANLDSARADLDYARKNYDRQKTLVEKKLVAQNDLDQAEQSLKVSESNVAARKATLNRLRAEFDKELVKARRTIEETKASIETVEIRLSYFNIHAPITGVVSQVAAQEGETLVSGLQVSNLITILDPLSLEMWIYVDETDVGQVKPGMPVEFTVDSYPDHIYEGSVNQIYPEPEIRDNIVYYQAIVKLDREQAKTLRPDMTTQCKIVVKELTGVLAIPNTALKWVDGKQVVFIQGEAGAVEKVSPELGLQGLEYSQVLSGLTLGQTVAVQVSLGKAPSTANRPPSGGPGR